ncbi:hypothetical protein Syun_012542 [Stephania yunnanensis]|uniref:Bifunctional inhibitor/plant lipid transfer protein/seed storage helical domain-containing protein n=1 Tax=Stephania yunnanensis TaxID=152371 RepID=A0AAP0JZP6_9MAGN
MASKEAASAVLLLALNLLLFTLVTSCGTCGPAPKPPKRPPPPKKPKPPPFPKTNCPPPPAVPKPPTTVPKSPPPPPPVPKSPPPPTAVPKSPPPPPATDPPPPTQPHCPRRFKTSMKSKICSSARPKCPPAPKPSKAYCPRDTLKLGVCANLLDDLVHLVVGTPAKQPCCSLIEGLLDLEAAVCLCTVIKADVLGLKLRVPVALSLLLNNCGKKVPKGFKCPN